MSHPTTSTTVVRSSTSPSLAESLVHSMKNHDLMRLVWSLQTSYRENGITKGLRLPDKKCSEGKPHANSCAWRRVEELAQRSVVESTVRPFTSRYAKADQDWTRAALTLSRDVEQLIAMCNASPGGKVDTSSDNPYDKTTLYLQVQDLKTIYEKSLSSLPAYHRAGVPLEILATEDLDSDDEDRMRLITELSKMDPKQRFYTDMSSNVVQDLEDSILNTSRCLLAQKHRFATPDVSVPRLHRRASLVPYKYCDSEGTGCL